MNSKKASLLMMSVSFAWGSSYLLMKVGLEDIGPFNLIALRFGIAFISMILIFAPRFKSLTTSIIKKGSFMGILLFLLFTGLVFGVNHTTASTAGFLASTTVVIVPILESILKRTLPSPSILISILLTISGLYLLTATNGLSFDIGAVLCLLAAFCYAIYIIILDRMSKNEDTFLISIIQLGVASALGIIATFIFETPALPGTLPQWGAILGLGLICSAYGFVVQPIAQRHLSSEKVGLIFAMEPLFSAILSYLFLSERLAFSGYLGASLIFIGIVYSQLPKGAIHSLWSLLSEKMAKTPSN